MERMNAESTAAAGRGVMLALSAGIAAVVFWDGTAHSILVYLLLAAMNLIFCLATGRMYQILKELSGVVDRMVDGFLEDRPLPDPVETDDGIVSRIYDKLKKLYGAKMLAMQKTRQETAATHALISDISHQVKTPVANIKIYAGILKKRLQDSGCLADLEILEEQADKLDFFMQSLLKMSRLETNVISMHIRSHKLLDIVASALGTVLPKAEAKQIRLETHCSRELIVSADRKWTAEAIYNILDNAVKYTDHGGWIQVTAVPLESYISLEIADNGIGMETDEIPLVFQRFYRGDAVREKEGLGLGLALARKILTMEDGTVTAESEIGKGSRFRLMLPRGVEV